MASFFHGGLDYLDRSISRDGIVRNIITVTGGIIHHTLPVARFPLSSQACVWSSNEESCRSNDDSASSDDSAPSNDSVSLDDSASSDDSASPADCTSSGHSALSDGGLSLRVSGAKNLTD